MLTFCDQYQGNISLDDFPSAETVDDSYRIEWIQDFSVWYKSIHGYASIVVCVLGSILNVWNLFILSKKEMRTSANIILIGLAVADLLNMIEYIPFVTYMKLWPYKSNGMSEKTYSWAVFVLVHIILSQICHTAAICLTVILSIWRLIMATMINGKICCTTQRAKRVVATAYVMSIIICVPIFLELSISEVEYPNLTNLFINSTEVNTMEAQLICKFLYSRRNSTANIRQYVVNINANTFPYLEQSIFWFYSIVVKILPCIVLTVVSALLVRSLLSVKKRKEELFGDLPLQVISNVSTSSIPTNIRRESQTMSAKALEKQIHALTRSAKAVIAICVLFLFTEFPHGLLALLSGILGQQFFKSYYVPLSEIMDILVLINYSLNFIVYCLMSQTYRKVFIASFIRLTK